MFPSHDLGEGRGFTVAGFAASYAQRACRHMENIIIEIEHPDFNPEPETSPNATPEDQP